MKIAIVGAGVSGLGAALALSEVADVRLFEKDPRFGGHANTVEVDYPDGKGGARRIPVDTGFIVFNERNYPNFTGLLDHLGVASKRSDMTFSVSLDQGRMEYACTSLDHVFAQRRRLLDPQFIWSMREVFRFHRSAPLALARGELDGLSLEEFLEQGGYQKRFRETFLYPMGGAIWSTPSLDMAAFPARGFVQFFMNHALLSGFNKEIGWRTVDGGSREYVRRVLARLGPKAEAGVGATAVRRLSGGGVEVGFSDGSQGVFDHVVLASHADQSLALLQDADAEERSVLAGVRYTPNVAVLHRDPALMPRRKKVWSSWNFLSQSGEGGRKPAVSYWMNRLQNIDPAAPLFVTLNPPRDPDPALTFGRFEYGHPQFDGAAFDSQERLGAIQGRGGVWHAGAWTGWGFHEDGLRSGLRVAEAFGARPGWARGSDRTAGAEAGDPVAIAAE